MKQYLVVIVLLISDLFLVSGCGKKKVSSVSLEIFSPQVDIPKERQESIYLKREKKTPNKPKYRMVRELDKRPPTRLVPIREHAEQSPILVEQKVTQKTIIAVPEIPSSKESQAIARQILAQWEGIYETRDIQTAYQLYAPGATIQRMSLLTAKRIGAAGHKQYLSLSSRSMVYQREELPTLFGKLGEMYSSINVQTFEVATVTMRNDLTENIQIRVRFVERFWGRRSTHSYCDETRKQIVLKRYPSKVASGKWIWRIVSEKSFAVWPCQADYVME
ncbi:hypothetical protein J7L81_02375 [Candidatus Aerophobetes bacterium]|nr:hypothetical protein [Candidatus Aerophobetes bacterium]